MMTRRERMKQLIIENPKIDNTELADKLGITKGYVTKELAVMKKDGIFSISRKDGRRYITVNEPLKPIGNSEVKHGRTHKQEVYFRIIDALIVDFEEAETTTGRVEIGQLLFRLLNKV